MTKRRSRRTWGAVRKMPSGRYQASYLGPDQVRHTGPHPFDTVEAADLWLAGERVSIAGETWETPVVRGAGDGQTLKVYADAWLAGRDLKPRTRAHYRRLLDQQILPALGARPLSAMTPTVVRTWYGDQDRDKPTLRAHAYALLRTVLTSAVDEEILTTNPCRIRGAGVSKRAKGIEPATLPQLERMVEKMPEEYRLLVLLAAWCALRSGEVTELRRKDIDVAAGVIRVRRGVVWVSGNYVVGDPKSDAGVRDVNIPPHLIPPLKVHLSEHTARGPDSLLFPGRSGSWLPPSTLRAMWHTAREAGGRPDLTFHSLRHTGAVLAAATGATLAELMARLGHSTPGAAMRYQHAAADRDKAIAAALSKMATPTKSRRRTASSN